MAKRTERQGIVGYIRRYLQMTPGKLIIWSLFLIPYVLVIIFYSGVLPFWLQVEIQKVVYTSSLKLWEILPTPIPRAGAMQAFPTQSNPEALTIGYFLVTYLWSCILVENFGILSLCVRRHQRRS